jgi:hypothetical protein
VIATVTTTKGYDALLVAHTLLAIGAFVVLAVLRAAAAAAAGGGQLSTGARRSFSGRHELAGRVVHLVPLSGVGLLALSRGAYSFATPFVAVGLGAWAVAAWSLEGVAFPAQRAVATTLAAGELDVRGARRILRGTEVAALAVAVAAVVMVVGTG